MADSSQGHRLYPHRLRESFVPRTELLPQPGSDVLIHSLCPCTFPFHCPLPSAIDCSAASTRSGMAQAEPTFSLPLYSLLHVRKPARDGQVAAPCPRTVPETQRRRTPSCPDTLTRRIQAEVSTGVDVKLIVVRAPEESMTSPTNGSFITTANRGARQGSERVVTGVTTMRDSASNAHFVKAGLDALPGLSRHRPLRRD